MSAAPGTLASLDARARNTEARKVIFSSYLGSTIEFYDFLLYASASALVFPYVFFTDLDPLAGTIAAYGTFAAGYLARPLGGAVFGHFGDRLGRKKMLIISMLIMGIASTLIGLIPSAAVIGSWGAVILILLRVCQGIAVGGEWGGAALMALEHSAKGRRGFAASFTNAGAPTGAALGTFVLGLFAAMPEEQFLSWGWRVPFLLSVLLLAVGVFVRSQVSESPIFQAALAKEAAEGPTAKRKVPIVEVLRRPRALVYTMLAGASGFALQVFLATFAVAYAVERGADRQPVLYAFALASVLSVFFVVGMGRLSDQLGRRPVMVVGGGAVHRPHPPHVLLAGHRQRAADLRDLHHRAGLPRRDLRTVGGLHLGAVRHVVPLHRRVTGLPVRHPDRGGLHPHDPRLDLRLLRAGHRPRGLVPGRDGGGQRGVHPAHP